MRTDPITNTDDTIEARDLAGRIKELIDLGGGEWYDNEEELGHELGNLFKLNRALRERYPVTVLADMNITLIRDSYFETFVIALLEDVHGKDVIDQLSCYIDWARCANDFKTDYFSVDFNGERYLVRS